MKKIVFIIMAILFVSLVNADILHEEFIEYADQAALNAVWTNGKLNLTDGNDLTSSTKSISNDDLGNKAYFGYLNANSTTHYYRYIFYLNVTTSNGLQFGITEIDLPGGG